jgi:hypothetical protein
MHDIMLQLTNEEFFKRLPTLRDHDLYIDTTTLPLRTHTNPDTRLSHPNSEKI